MCGLDSTVCDTYFVCTPPTAAFNHSASGNTVTFTDATITQNTVSSWNWDFAGAGTSTSQNPVFTFAGPGNYTVCLSVTDSCSTGSVCQTITICQPPLAAFSFTVSGPTATFTDGSIAGAGATYFWDFDGLGTSTQQNPIFTFPTGGVHNVCLTVTDNCASDTICIQVTTTAVTDPFIAEHFSVYPNPASTAVNILSKSNELFTLRIMDMNGRVIFQNIIGKGENRFDLSGFSDGVYSLILSGEEHVGEFRLVKDE
jgi:PKD repeat protein